MDTMTASERRELSRLEDKLDAGFNLTTEEAIHHRQLVVKWEFAHEIARDKADD